MEKSEIKEYPVCPVCGSEEALIATLANEEVSKGINTNVVPHNLHTWPFMMRNQNYPLMIGSRAPGGNIIIDVCKGCGIIRAVRVEVGEAIALDKTPKIG